MALLDDLVEVARAEVAKAARQRTGLERRGSYRALRPGPESPLWNALVPHVLLRLQRHGAKAHLARYLGVPRQRVHQYFKDGTQLPDAERLLRLLVWLRSEYTIAEPAVRPARARRARPRRPDGAIVT